MKTSSTVSLITVASLIWVLVVPGQVQAGKPGESGFLSLRLGVGAREAGMGNSGVAASNDASAIYWNPANLAFVEYRTDLLLQHQRWMGLFSNPVASLAHRTKFGDIGIFFSGFYSDEIQRYDAEAVGIPQGTFSPHDVVFGLTFSRKIFESLSFGIGGKMLHEEIDVYSATSYALDFFLSHKAVIEGLVFGASWTNVGPDITLNQEPFPLPTTIRLGIAYAPMGKLFRGKMTVTGDVLIPNDGTEKAHVGLEWRLIKELALRFGSNINYDARSLTAGAGFRVGVVEVGYAYEEMKDTTSLDPAHKFALQLHY